MKFREHNKALTLVAAIFAVGGIGLISLFSYSMTTVIELLAERELLNTNTYLNLVKEYNLSVLNITLLISSSILLFTHQVRGLVFSTLVLLLNSYTLIKGLITMKAEFLFDWYGVLIFAVYVLVIGFCGIVIIKQFLKEHYRIDNFDKASFGGVMVVLLIDLIV